MTIQSTQKSDIWNLFLQAISLTIAIISTYFMFTNSDNKELNTSTLIIFGIIIGIIIIVFIFMFIKERYKNIEEEIKTNKKAIENIESDLNYKELFNKMEIRITVLEELLKMKKKGNSSIDPRIIMIIILVVLFLLFLKSLGKI